MVYRLKGKTQGLLQQIMAWTEIVVPGFPDEHGYTTSSYVFLWILGILVHKTAMDDTSGYYTSGYS